MLHLDGLCNECGNCASFCPERTAPYLEKLTVFCSPEELENSINAGFAPLSEGDRFLLRWDGACREVRPDDPAVPEAVRGAMAAVRERYPWLLYR